MKSIVTVAIAALFSFSCSNNSEKKFDLEKENRFKSIGNKMLDNFQLDSASIFVDSLKIIGIDSNYIKNFESIIEKKRKLKNAIPGVYVFEKSGVVLSIEILSSDSVVLKSNVNGLSSIGIYSIQSDSAIKIKWNLSELNNSMDIFIFSVENKYLKNKFGNKYIRKIVTTSKIKETKSQSSSAPIKKIKKYVSFCGSKYDSDTDFSSTLPYNYRELVGYYCLKNYREGAESVRYIGYNSNGILVKAVGEISGREYTILFTCDGQLY